MNKKFYFMAGIPRSGGSLISSIISQNPDIYVSPQSVLPNTLGAMYNQYQSKENKDSDQWDSIYSVMETIIPTFYSGKKEKHIIDRNFSWLDPHPYLIIEHHLKNPIKVICPVRNIMDVLASWNRLCENDLNNFYDVSIMKNDKTKRPMADKRADYFMNTDSLENGIKRNIDNTKRALHHQIKNNVMIVEYDNLILNTKSVINNIYKFLEIKNYDHDFKNISSPHKYTDGWGIKNHHKIKETIQKEDYILEDIFSSSTIKKYSNLEFWKEH